MLKYFFLGGWLLTCLTLEAVDAKPVILDDQIDTIDLARHLFVFTEAEPGLNIRAVSQHKANDRFRTNSEGRVNFGYAQQDLWLRLELDNRSATDWLLLIDLPVGGAVELFILPQTDGSAANPEALAQPLNSKHFERLTEHRTPVWQLKLRDFPGGSQFTIYLRVNNGRSILLLPMRLMTMQAFLAHSNQQYIFFTAIFAGLWVLALYNLLLFYSLRDRNFLRLGIFIILLQIMLYRIGNTFPALSFANDTQAWYHSAMILIVYAAGVNYWRAINAGANRLLERLLKWMQWGALAILPVAMFVPESTRYLFLIFVPFAPVLLFLVTQSAWQGHRLTRSSYFAALIFILSFALYTPLYTGWFPDYPVYTQYLGYAGHLLAVLLLSINHADRSRLLREQAKHAEAAKQAAHNFLTTMSHELRTPMHTVVGVKNLLQATPLSAEQHSHLSKLETASQHMLGLIDDVLDLASLNHKGQQPIEASSEPFDLGVLLNDLGNLLSISAAQKQLAFSVRTQGTPYPMLLGDARRLNQVLFNLISNAIKYTDSGQVSLQVTANRIAARPAFSVHFSIEDSGAGIPLEQQASIFQPFYQVNSQRSRQAGGAGLGLSISYQLVQLMKGELQLESQPGQGSRFFFSLDLPISTRADKPVQTPRLPLKGVTILLVDDGELNRLIGETLLIAQGAVVVLADSGQSALRKIAQQSFDLVLMDISMPDMDGYEVTRRLRHDAQFREYRQLLIIALTAHAIAGERERCLAAGMNDYLSKPFRMEQLVQLVDHYRNKRPADSSVT